MEDEQDKATYVPPAVTGYRKLTSVEVAAVNDMKSWEASIGAVVAEMRQDTSLNQRAVATGATHLQTAFMWLNRAIMKPTTDY